MKMVGESMLARSCVFRPRVNSLYLELAIFLLESAGLHWSMIIEPISKSTRVVAITAANSELKLSLADAKLNRRKRNKQAMLN